MPRLRSRYTVTVGGVVIEEDEVVIEEEEENNEDEEGGEEDEDDEEDTEEEEEDEEEEEEERQTTEYIDVSDSLRDSQNENKEKENQRKCSAGVGEGICSSSGSQEASGCKPSDTEGISCLICMDVWTNGGEHQICCLPCGHLYGFSCIKKWLQQRRSAGKCPQCNRACSIKDIRKIFASKIAAVDDEAQKRILFLEAKLSSMEQMTASWDKKEAQWKKVEAKLHFEVNKLMKRIAKVESTINVASQEQHHGQELAYSFKHQGERLVSGGRIFDIDGARQIILLARRLTGVGGTFVLTQMSLNSSDIDDILLPPTTKAIKDLHLSPHNNGLAVFGSLGKKLSVLSLESHNTVLSYDLPAAPWSCSWDLTRSHHIYAGLQNGMVLVFDMRQTMGPVASLAGLSSNPVHTVHHLSTANSTPTSDARFLLSASSIGISQWNINDSERRPSLVFEEGSQGVCISSSYCPRSDRIVASYRPRVGSSNDSTISSQPSLTQTGITNGVDGSHISLERRNVVSYYQKLSSTQAFVDTIRLPRTAIIDFGEERKQLFASCDESTRELILQDPSSFVVSQRLPLVSHLPIQDMKYANVNGSGLLGLLTDDRLQLLRNESS